jgi:subfamily B ATP-binding cassette protein HlyB/CyaB
MRGGQVKDCKMKSTRIAQEEFFLALQGFAPLHRKPFSAELAQQQLAAPYTDQSFLQATLACGFDACLRNCKAGKLHKESFPLIAG